MDVVFAGVGGLPADDAEAVMYGGGEPRAVEVSVLVPRNADGPGGDARGVGGRSRSRVGLRESGPGRLVVIAWARVCGQPLKQRGELRDLPRG